jgi:hypothetical protein
LFGNISEKIIMMKIFFNYKNMTVIIHDLDVNKTELSYEEFIDVLSQKAL